jgi:hypothetical protein
MITAQDFGQAHHDTPGHASTKFEQVLQNSPHLRAYVPFDILDILKQPTKRLKAGDDQIRSYGVWGIVGPSLTGV